MTPGMLDVETIRDLIANDQIDTVLMVFPDLQGRFMGKRVTGDYFVRDILEGEGAIHACNYLLAVDMEMEPLPGYRDFNWESGYGDLKAVPDMTTLRRIPWLEKTALVFRDSFEEAAGKGYRSLQPHSDYIMDYHILQTTKDEYVIREIRNHMDNAG